MSRSVDLSFVVPVFGNAESLPELAARVRGVFQERAESYELVLVDDASPDDSLAVARRLAADDPAVGVLGLERNVGQQPAILIGLARTGGDWVVVLDADLQDPPEAVPDLLERGREGFDAVFAGRRGRYQRRSRMITSRLFKRSIHHLCGVPPDAGLYVALSRRLVEELLRRRPDTWILPMIGFSGLPMTSVPVERSPRSRGRSAYSAWGRWRIGLAVAGYAVRRRWPRVFGRCERDRP